MEQTPKVAIVTNIAWNLYNFRRGLAGAIKNAGYEPVLMASPDRYADKLQKEGWQFIPLKNMERAGINPLADMRLLFDLLRIYRKMPIKCALHYTAKPLVYASLCASMLHIPYLPTITGLAGPFSGDRTIISKIVTFLYKMSLRDSYRILFQNQDDLNFFLKKKMTQFQKSVVVPGSGINLGEYMCESYTVPRNGKIIFLMFARLSRAKGIEYYVNAAREIKKKYPNTTFRLAGPFECDKLAISKGEIEAWHNEGVIEYLGVSDCIRTEISGAHVIVYPSFYCEGIPKSLIESAAMARPIITTHNVGCREVVEDGVNGYLVPVKDTQALVTACEKFILLSNEEKLHFSLASRIIAGRFDEKKVIPQYLSLIQSCLQKSGKNEVLTDYKNIA